MRSTGIWALALTSLLSTQAFAVELPGKGVTVKPLQSTERSPHNFPKA